VWSLFATRMCSWIHSWTSGKVAVRSDSVCVRACVCTRGRIFVIISTPRPDLTSLHFTSYQQEHYFCVANSLCAERTIWVGKLSVSISLIQVTRSIVAIVFFSVFQRPWTWRFLGYRNLLSSRALHEGWWALRIFTQVRSADLLHVSRAHVRSSVAHSYPNLICIEYRVQFVVCLKLPSTYYKKKA